MKTRLRDARKLIGKNQDELSEIIGCSQVTISAWECGSREPSIEALIKIADLAGCTLDWLLCRDDTPPAPAPVVIKNIVQVDEGKLHDYVDSQLDKAIARYFIRNIEQK